MPQPSPTRYLALAGIGAIVAVLAAALAWTAGWIGGRDRLTAQHMTDSIEANNKQPYPGYRRAHSKGVCVTGTFHANGQAASLSKARVFQQAEVPVVGRLSIAGGDPHGADNSARVRSMALLLTTDDGQQWRTAMNSFPFFVVATPAGFQAQTVASRPDPATGKPDPEKIKAFLAAYPEARRFQAWAKEAPWSDSWANTQYNGVNAFRFTAADGRETFVRWSMRPQAPFRELDAAQREQAGVDFLAQELQQRLAQGPLRWDLLLTVAEPGDPVNDPSQPWPQGRTEVEAGTLVIEAMQPQAQGQCRDINYDPLILPDGIAGSDDPILAARSAVYSQSFNRREREIAHGHAPEATGQEAAR